MRHAGWSSAAPYRESAHALLIQALAARGDIAEATLAYDRLRTLLRDELGTMPAPAIVALHDRLLAGDALPQGGEVASLPGPLAPRRGAARSWPARPRRRACAGPGGHRARG